MARLAIFIDGGYIDALAEREFFLWVDYDKFAKEITKTISDNNAEPLDLLRTYYYNCLPYQSSPASPAEADQFAKKRSFFEALSRLDKFQVREGRLALRGHDNEGRPIFQQKRTDIQLGLDFALLSGKGQITHAALVAGDSDFIPAVEIAKQEGVIVTLFHGPTKDKREESNYAQELWSAADERIELTQSFMESVRLIRQTRRR